MTPNPTLPTRELPWPVGIADRDWTRKARVRLLHDVGGCAPVGRPAQYRQGQELTLMQMGRRGRELTPEWWTNGDIDAAHIFDPHEVEVVEEYPDRTYPPYFADAAMSTDATVALLGEVARSWRGQGVIVVEDYGDWQVRRAGAPYELLGLVWGYYDRHLQRHVPEEPLTYRVSRNSQDDSRWRTVEAGPIPADPVAVTERIREGQA